MVKINFKLSDIGPMEIQIKKPETLDHVLTLCREQTSIDIGEFIGIRNSRVITREQIVESGDEINICPAITGG